MLDLIWNDRPAARCDGMSRRNALRIGALSALGLGLSLPGFLSLRNAQAGDSHPKARAKSVILVFLGGGLSHHDSFDMKPDARSENRGKYSSIETCLPGTRICEKLPMMARTMDKVALVRSGAHNNDHHETATNWVLSGRFGSPFGDYPAVGAVVAHNRGFQSHMPPYVAIPRNPSFTWELGKSAFLGGRFESFKTGDPNDANFQVRDLTPLEPLPTTRVDRRKSLLSAVDDLARQVEGNDQMITYDEFNRQAATMIFSPETRKAFNMGEEDPRLRDRYGRTTFGQSCLLARRLVERGVTFSTINFGGWDHHAKIWEGLEKRLPDFDQGFSALIEDMHVRGLLKDTLVVAMGEFGRTPKINKDVGRDHWGPAASLLFAGAGVHPGLVMGKTDKLGAYVTTRPIAPADVAWTIYECLGIDPQGHLMSPEGRPIEILDRGALISELFV